MSRLTIVSHRSSIKSVKRGERGGERGERQLLYVEDLCVGYVKSCIDVGGTRLVVLVGGSRYFDHTLKRHGSVDVKLILSFFYFIWMCQ